ncbi:MAG: chemotaxis protein CheW [Candidatus Hodarchaeales archaeon]|jgi:chemotaxis signal transduction protein
MTLVKSKEKDKAKDSLVLFTLKGERYTIENTSVVQILYSLSITQVANATPYLLGSTVFQGEVLPVIDLQIFFYGKDKNQIEFPDDSRSIFIVLEHQGKSAVFSVENIIGIITRSSEILSMDSLNLRDPKEKQYYKSVFLWEDQMIAQLNIETIFEKIRTELQENQSQSLAEINLHLPSIENPEILEEYNIDLQHKLTSKPTIGWSIDRLMKQPKVRKYTGTIVTIDDLSILVPNESLKQIFSISELTNVPNSSQAVMGVINYHGEVINTINLSKVLSDNQDTNKAEDFVKGEKKKVLILENNNDKIALFVDSTPRIVEIDKKEIRQTLILDEKKNMDYLFDGAILDKSGQIILVLNVSYLFKRYFTIDEIEEGASLVISFNNPTDVSYKRVQESSQEGLIFEDEGNIYFVDSEFIKQVMVQESFLYKDFDHDAILGAATYWDTVPLMDFNYLIHGKISKRKNKKKNLGVLLHDPKSGIEATFLISNIIGRVSIDAFEAFQPETSFYTKMLSRLISGYFSFQDSLGVIVNPSFLLEEAYLIIKNNLKLGDVKTEFISTLMEKEREILESMVALRKEREPLLFSHPKDTRLDYFVFQWHDSMLAIEVSSVQRVVISSLKIKKVEPASHPVIGEAKFENIKYLILDLNSVVMNDDHRVDLNTDCYFSFSHDKYSFLVPVDNLIGVITTFKEDLQPCEETNLFLEGSECCQNKFSHKNIISPMYIIDNDFLTKLLTQNGIKTSLKKINIQKTDLED